MISHTKKYGIYHWDTFDNETILMDQSDSYSEAEEKVKARYGSRLRFDGADVVEIVDMGGNILKRWKVG